MPATTVEQRQYIIANDACTICVDDFVRVTRKAKDHEAGWALCWKDSMDATVGRATSYRVLCKVTDGYVLSIDNGKHETFPWFVLEKVIGKRDFSVKLSDLETYDRILVRNEPDEVWRPDFFGKIRYGEPVTIRGESYSYCIPYEGNEHLAFTAKPEGSR